MEKEDKEDRELEGRSGGRGMEGVDGERYVILGQVSRWEIGSSQPNREQSLV